MERRRWPHVGDEVTAMDPIQILKDLIKYGAPGGVGVASDQLSRAEQQAAQAAGVSIQSIAIRSGFIIVGVLLLLVVVVALLFEPAERTATTVARVAKVVK